MTRYQLASSIALIGLLFASVSSHAQQTNYDFVITGTRIVDGTGAPWFIGDIGIVGDHIAAIGDLQHAVARQRIDAKGLVATPGFIDVQGQSEFNVLVDSRAASKITQGVTTEITGEGTSIAPLKDRLLEDLQDSAKKYEVALDWRSLDEYLRRYDRARPAINLGTFVGAGGLREYVIGKDNRPALRESSQLRALILHARPSLG
jgi:dihydroorotase/N-acyl-D-amino-acid deacylase